MVYWDYSTAALVRRAVPAAWLAGHEFRWLRPGDTFNLPGPLLAGAPLRELRRELTGTCAGIRPTTTVRERRSAGFCEGSEALCAEKGAKCAK